MEKKTGSRKEKAAATKEKLYAVAEALFTKRGIDRVSVDEIVAAAGLSKGAFYVHFASKNELAASLLGDYVSRIDMGYKAFLDGHPRDTPTEAILFALLARIFDTIEDVVGPERMTLLYRAQLAEPSAVTAASGYDRALYAMLTEVVARGVERGELRAALVPEALVRHLVLAMRGLVYEWCIRYPAFNLKAEARTHFELMLKAVF